MQMRCMLLATVLLVSSFTLLGCNDGPETRIVSGTVTLDGQPLDDAIIEFDSSDGSVPTSVDIAEGKFTGELTLGKKKVRLYAMRPAKRDPRLSASDAHNPFMNILPLRYNLKSTLTLSVDSDDQLDLAYDLTSRKK